MTGGRLASRSFAPDKRAIWWFVLIASIFLLSVFALFQMRAGVYDESSLLEGAHLFRGGQLPYLDFYTHYGPLGFSIVAAWSHAIRNPGIALRGLQAVSFGAVLAALLMLRRGRDAAGSPLLGLGGIAFGAFMAANAFQTSAFLGFAFSLATLALAVLSQTSPSGRRVRVAAAAAGIALVLAGLVRPAFAAYTAVAMAAIGLASKEASEDSGLASARLWLPAVSAVVALPALWILLFHRIPPATAVRASILGPGRLVSGGERFMNPRFLLGPSGDELASWGAVLAGGIIVAASAGWILAARSAATRALALAASAAGAIGTARLERSGNPAREAAWLAAAILLVGLLAVFRMRREIAESACLAAGAFFGIAALAFGHYFWSRTDREHLAPALAMASLATAFAWPRLAGAARVVLVILFSTLVLLFPQLPLRLPAQVAKGGPVWSSPAPAGTVPRDAVEAVRFADEHSDPGSRFVAVASTHAVTSANPVLLFLLSSRRPYTRWYTYDPGVQSSPAAQEQMIGDLARSGSRTAVVWDARIYVFEPRIANLARRTPLDEAFDGLYPVRAARFGEFEVRFRADRPSP